jgi:methyltransferase family protein
MLGPLLKSIWSRMIGNAGIQAPLGARSDGVSLQSEVQAALASLLREPLAHPKTIDYEMVAHLMAATSSADYMINHMMGARNLVRRSSLLEFALDECTIEGLVLEFGVYRGSSLCAIAERAGQEVHGFDSFEGLPEDWTYFQKQGRFSLRGDVPVFDMPGVRIHKGWFDQALPQFLIDHPGSVRFIHVDCDVYSSTRTVLQLLTSRIVSGSVILFDEYLNYPAWQKHEFKAFQEFVAQTGKGYRYIGFASSDCAVAVKML